VSSSSLDGFTSGTLRMLSAFQPATKEEAQRLLSPEWSSPGVGVSTYREPSNFGQDFKEEFISTTPNPLKDGDGKPWAVASYEKLRKGTVREQSHYKSIRRRTGVVWDGGSSDRLYDADLRNRLQRLFLSAIGSFDGVTAWGREHV
jgi:hypothetical protein